MSDALLAETTMITGNNGDTIEAYSARALDESPRGGVVVIHHLPGYDPQTKEIARNFAYHGYNAVVPNLYWREAPGASPENNTRASEPPIVTVGVAIVVAGGVLGAAEPLAGWFCTGPRPVQKI